ncbi:MAG: hypothetical protein RR988_04820 [Clostridia bacterium]
MPSVKDAYRTLLCISNNEVRLINGAKRLIYKIYPLTFTYENRARLEQILQLIAKFSEDKNFIRHIEASHGYLGKLIIKDSNAPNAFGAFVGWDYMDIPIWEIAKNTYTEVEATGNMLTQAGLRCFYDDTVQNRIKKYIFVKNLGEDNVDIMQVFCTLRDNIDRKIGANILSYMLEQPDIYRKYDDLKSDYMGDLYKDKDGYKLKIEPLVKKEIDELLYKRFIQKFPEIEMTYYVNKNLYIKKNDYGLDIKNEKDRLQEITQSIIKEQARKAEQEAREDLGQDVNEDREILTTGSGLTAEDINRMQNLTRAGLVKDEMDDKVVKKYAQPQVVAKPLEEVNKSVEMPVNAVIEKKVEPIRSSVGTAKDKARKMLENPELSSPIDEAVLATKAKEYIENVDSEINPFKNGMTVARVANLDENGNEVVNPFAGKPVKSIDLEAKILTPEKEKERIEKIRKEEEKARIKEEAKKEEVHIKTDEEKAKVDNIPADKTYEEAPEISYIVPEIKKAPSYDDDDIILTTHLPNEAKQVRSYDQILPKNQEYSEEGQKLRESIIRKNAENAEDEENTESKKIIVDDSHTEVWGE